MTKTPTGTLPALLAAALLLGGCVAVAPDGTPRAQESAGDPERLAQVRLALAAEYLGRGQPEIALTEVRRALAVRPEMAEAHALQGVIQARLGDARQADESFQRALRLNPRSGETMHQYGWFLCQERRYDDAEAMFERALAQPQYRNGMETLFWQGVCHARAGRWEPAERALSRSYELDPGNPVTAYNLSEVLLQRGELDRARFYARRINSQPGQVTAQSLWLAARIEHRAGNRDSLRDIGRQLRERFPQSTETLQFERGRFE
ncbi:MAG: type IV pilus biogenesis/stability protein PilW [Rubrivivax sp.]|nr:type IV pilus biogenesis/stability protein PilW [Rubrivivax sp.]